MSQNKLQIFHRRKMMALACARRASAADRKDCAKAWVRIARSHSRAYRVLITGIKAGTVTAAMLIASACAYVRPLAEARHDSVTTQHVDGEGHNYGCNLIGGGLRWRPLPKVQVDVIEAYSLEPCFGQYHEVFSAKFNWEF